MSKDRLIQKLEKEQMKADIVDFCVGDTIRVHTRIIEGNKERVQMYTGTVIARKGTGISETFSVHRVAYGEGTERVFVLHSPRIAKIEVLKHGDVRRAKLYHIRGKYGKAAKIKGLIGKRKERIAKETYQEEETNDNEYIEAEAQQVELETVNEASETTTTESTNV